MRIKIQTTVYRKPTASDRYAHFSSNQAWREKVITISTLKQRAEDYCSTIQLKNQEFEHLFNTFISNGYPPNIIHRYLYNHKPAASIPEEKTQPIKNIFHVPFHPLASSSELFNKNFKSLPYTRKQIP
jgi:hypothetical protein